MRLNEAIAIYLAFRDAPGALTPEAQTVVEHARQVIATHAQEAFERHCDRPERGQLWCIQSDATLCTFPDCECPPRVASIRKGE